MSYIASFSSPSSMPLVCSSHIQSNSKLLSLFYLLSEHSFYHPTASSNHVSKLSIIVVQHSNLKASLIACCQIQLFFQSMPCAETLSMAPCTPSLDPSYPKSCLHDCLYPECHVMSQQLMCSLCTQCCVCLYPECCMLCHSDWHASTILGRIPVATCIHHLTLCPTDRHCSTFPCHILVAKSIQCLPCCVSVTNVLLNLPILCSSSQIHPTNHMLHPSHRWISSTFPCHIPATSRQSTPCHVSVTNLQPHLSHLASQQPSRPRMLHVVSLQLTCHIVSPSGHSHLKPFMLHSSNWPASSSIPCYAPLNSPPKPLHTMSLWPWIHSLIHPSYIIMLRHF